MQQERLGRGESALVDEALATVARASMPTSTGAPPGGGAAPGTPLRPDDVRAEAVRQEALRQEARRQELPSEQLWRAAIRAALDAAATAAELRRALREIPGAVADGAAEPRREMPPAA